MRPLALTLVLLLGACGARATLPASDGGTADLGPSPSTAELPPAAPALDGGAQPAPSVPPPTCPGDPDGPVCDLYPDGFLCPPGARRTVIGCRPFCQDLATCAEVPPLPAKLCGTNGDCQADQYCLKDLSCVVTGAIAGQCQPRPSLASCPIPKVCPGVCGCDGKTYCDTCHAHASGVSLATTAACLAPTCAGLEALYVAEVQKAKQCCPACNLVQCTTKVPAKLGCSCDTIINGPTGAVEAARKEWLARGCALGLPPCGIKCAPPEPGFCAPIGGGVSGTCVDAGGK